MQQRHNRIWTAVLLVATGLGQAHAAKSATLEPTELSMLLRGTVDIAADGSVTRQSLDNADALPAPMRDRITTAINGWKFQPVLVDGQPAASSADMSLLVVATRQGEDGLQMRLRSASFVDKLDNKEESVRSQSMHPPRYPEEAFRKGAMGTVYLALKVGRDGKVEQAIDEQVNLRNRGSEAEMDKVRGVLASASIKQAYKWRFHVPTKGPDADKPYWSVRVPVSFHVATSAQRPPELRSGTWVAYVPGPRKQVPWRTDDAGSDPQAMQDGVVYQDGRGPKLLTSLGDS